MAIAGTLHATTSAQTTDAGSEPQSSASDEQTLLGGILVLGSTALPVSQVSASAEPFIGRPVTPELLRQIRLAVSAAHEDAGYSLISVDDPVMRGPTALIRIQQLRLATIEVGPSPNQAAPAAAHRALEAHTNDRCG